MNTWFNTRRPFVNEIEVVADPDGTHPMDDVIRLNLTLCQDGGCPLQTIRLTLSPEQAIELAGKAMTAHEDLHALRRSK